MSPITERPDPSPQQNLKPQDLKPIEGLPTLSIPANLTTSIAPAAKSPAQSQSPVASGTGFSPQPAYPRHLKQRGIGQIWQNLGLRFKLSTILGLGVAVPVLTITQTLVSLSSSSLEKEMTQTINTTAEKFRRDLRALKEQALARATTLAQAAQVKVNANGNALTSESVFLEGMVSTPLQRAIGYSFQIYVDAQGRTVAQKIQQLAADSEQLPSNPKAEVKAAIYQPVTRATGIPLGDVPIVQQVLRTGQPLHGAEVIKGDVLERLGLGQQAAIGDKPSKTDGLPETRTPFPSGTFDIDQGKAGLMIFGVSPIKDSNGQIIGAALVGTMLNRNPVMVDSLVSQTNMDVATIFAQDWRIATNVPAKDGKARAIGTRLARGVADVVLNQDKPFTGQVDILGRPYITTYLPIYDYRDLLGQRKPIGIMFAGRNKADLDAVTNQESLVGYGLGGGILLLALGLMLPVSGAFIKPLLTASKAVQKLGQGDLDTRVPVSSSDELGVLGNNINLMAGQIQNLLVEQEKATQEQLVAQAEIAAQQAKAAKEQQEAKEFLQNRALELLMEVSPLRQGDLTIRAKVTEDEVGTIADSYNATILSLRKLVSQVQTAAGQVAGTAETSQTSIQQLSTDARSQTGSVQAALTRITAMTESIQAVAEKAQVAEQAMQAAGQTVNQGDATMNRTVNEILNLRETIAEAARKVQQLGQSSQEISKVVKLIGTFAAQTNLLALKASIEAARAGEEGRGFVVLADEVRALAQQSAKATEEIEQLVSSIQSETREVVTAMEAGTQQVGTGTQLVEETRKSLSQIAESSDQIKSLVQAIAEAATFQTQTSQVVAETMTDVAGTANTTSTRANQVLAAFEELTQVAHELQTTVGQFKLS